MENIFSSGLTKFQAIAIMAAFALCYNEGYSPIEVDEAIAVNKAELEIAKEIKKQFPELFARYSYAFNDLT